jgi:acetolactate decarboxylase
VLDERLITALHVHTLVHDDLHADHEPHRLFQAATIRALLDGAYEGDVTFAELAEHGDHGLGTLNGLDGEMVAVDGRFFRADSDGWISEVPKEAKTPFAVMVWFSPTITTALERPCATEELLSALDGCIPPEIDSCAVRIDGEFERVRARSVPRQTPPYRPLTEVIADQTVFDISDVEGTIVGFRFPDYAEGVEVSGWHLHFIDAARRRGGHVLECSTRRAEAAIDPSDSLRVELPRGVDLEGSELAASTREALRRAEIGR